MQQYAEMMLLRHALHDGHNKQVMIIGQVNIFKDRRHLELIRGNLIMTGLNGNAGFESLVFQFPHESQHTCRNSSEVMVLELLRLGAVMAHERTAGEHQVRTRVIKCFIYQEILLFPTQICVYVFDLLVKITAHLTRRMTKSSCRTNQRCLIIECFTCVSHKDRRNTEGVSNQKNRTGWIPCRIATCLKSIADTARRKRRSVRFLLIKAVTAKLLQQCPTLIECKKSVVFLSRASCQRLEPMGKMRSSTFYCPFTDADSYTAGYIAMDRATVIHIVQKLVQHLLRDVLFHSLASEHIARKIVLHFAFRHFYCHRIMTKCSF